MKNFDINQFLTIISITIAYGYVLIYMLMGRNQNPSTYRYQKVLDDKKTLRNHIIFTGILAIIGLLRFNSLTLETYLFTPLIFLILLLISNKFIQRYFHRNILIETFNRYSFFSKRVNKKASFYDKFLGITISLISLISPLFMKQGKFKEMNQERKLYHMINSSKNNSQNNLNN